MKQLRFLLPLLFAFFFSLPAFAERGVFVRDSTAGVSSPENNKTFCFVSADQKLYVYSNDSWRPMILGHMNMSATSAPGVDDDSADGYEAGSVWLDTIADKIYVCSDAAVGAAKWYEFSNRISAADVLSKFTTSDTMSDFLVSGLVGTDPGATRTMTTPSGIGYVSGLRVVSSGGAYTYTASKDTYDYLQTDGTINHVAVNNADPTPSGQIGLLIQKVVTDSTEITSVTAQAASAPSVKVGTAINSAHAMSKGQADSTYAPIGIYSNAPANRFVGTPNGSPGVTSIRALVNADFPVLDLDHGGSNNGNLTAVNMCVFRGNGSQIVAVPAPSGGLKKMRSNSGNTEFEFVDDTNGTVTTISMTGDGVLYQSVVSISNPTSTPSIIPALRTDVGSNKFIGDNAGTWVERSIALADLPLMNLGIGGTNNPSLAATANRFIIGDGTKLIESVALSALQSIRMNAAGTALEAYDPGGSAQVPNGICDIRVSCTSGTPIDVTDKTAITSLYLQSYKGNRVCLYDGSAWKVCTLPSEITISLSGKTADTNYDIFLYDSDANGTADSVDVVAWTNSTTRATAIAYQDGIPCKTGALGRRLVCTFRTTGSTGQTENSAARRLVCNVQNTVANFFYAKDTTDSWTYNSTAYHVFNAAGSTYGTGACQVVVSLNESPVTATCLLASSYVASYMGGVPGIGVDSTSTNSAQLYAYTAPYDQNYKSSSSAYMTKWIGVGAHVIYPLEKLPSGSGTLTFYGDNGGIYQTGLTGSIMQ